jgi:hypothetical protein
VKILKRIFLFLENKRGEVGIQQEGDRLENEVRSMEE